MEWSGITVLIELQHESERQRCNRNSMRLRQLKEQTLFVEGWGNFASKLNLLLLFRNVILSCQGEGVQSGEEGWPLKMHKRCARHIELCNDCRLQRATCNVQCFSIHPQQQFFKLRKREREEEGRWSRRVTTHLTLWHVHFTFRIRCTANGKTNRTWQREADHVERVSIWFNNEWHLQQMGETLQRLSRRCPAHPLAVASPSQLDSVALFHLIHFQSQLIS